MENKIDSTSDDLFSEDEDSVYDYSSGSDELYVPGSDSGESTENNSALENEINIEEREESDISWKKSDGSTLRTFLDPPEPQFISKTSEMTPFECFQVFVTDDIIDYIVLETNRKAHQFINTHCISRNNRMANWVDTDRFEMKKFLGIILYMGLVKLPKIADYWSSNLIYETKFCKKVMPRNRFQLILRNLHFANNEENNNLKLFKIQPLIDKIISNIKQAKIPGKDLVIDESMIPFRGRLSFRQYMPGKAHKYGLKVFKLADPSGFIYNFEIYSGKNSQNNSFNSATNICIRLMADYFNQGRILTVDNFYTSIDLASICLGHQTHLQGTLRKNRKEIPKLSKKLKKGECIAMEKDGIVVGTWKDKRELKFLSTHQTGEMIGIGRKDRYGEEIMKPNIIVSYNQCKQGIDIADQMASYFTPLRKTLPWYHKVALEILFNVSIVNVYLLYGDKSIEISKFRKHLIRELTGNPIIHQILVENTHKLTQNEGKTNQGRKIRKRCRQCYDDIRKKTDSSSARKLAKLVTTFCGGCEESPFMCLDHFQQMHSISEPPKPSFLNN